LTAIYRAAARIQELSHGAIFLPWRLKSSGVSHHVGWYTYLSTKFHTYL